MVRHAQSAWPSAPIFALGYSLGANALTNYLGRTPSSPVRAAAVFCLAFDMHAAFARMDSMTIYREALLAKTKQLVRTYGFRN